MSYRFITIPHLISCAAVLFTLTCSAGNTAATGAPVFTHAEASAWINSRPLGLGDFKGRVLLIDVWTFDCWNCYRSIPWLKSMESRLGPKGLALLGVHSPEFPHEQEQIGRAHV